jgi:Nuclease-related domain
MNDICQKISGIQNKVQNWIPARTPGWQYKRMAKFYGKNSGYLIKGELKNYGIAVGLVFLVLIIFSIILKLSVLAAPLFGIFCIYLLVQIMEPVIAGFRNKSDKFYRGFNGELDIKKELGNLSDDFSIYQDAQLGDNKGNLDFVVLGPPGVFILEVKSHKGEVGYNGHNITINGREYGFLRQVHGQTWALKNYLKQQTGEDIFIHPVLVFSSPYAKLNFGYNPINNVYVIGRGFLLNLFGRFSASQSPGNFIKIDQSLIKTVKV